MNVRSSHWIRRALPIAFAFGLVLAFRTATAAPPTLAPPSSAPPESLVTTILVVRHAEKDTAATDPTLSVAGVARARVLAHVAGGAGVSAIYVTHYRRSRETALPLAQALGESLTVVDDTAEIVRRLRSRHWGKTVLVVGHFNTLPDIVRGLTGRSIPTFREDEFDRLYVITLTPGGQPGLIGLRYGAPAVAR